VLVGVWKNVIVIFLDEDVQTWTTVWRFESAGACRLSRTSFSLLEGFPRTSDRDCTFTVQGNEIVAAFPATSQTMRMPWDLVGVSPDRLRLEGIIYERIE
jgi:hypothetical protein